MKNVPKIGLREFLNGLTDLYVKGEFPLPFGNQPRSEKILQSQTEFDILLTFQL